MTAEIAIINKHGIALAADSAVTVGGKERVWNTANKIFSLSPHNDIGIMIYGNGSFIGFPWETIVKTFRQKNCSKKFATVKECADTLVIYLGSKEISKSVKDDRTSILLPCFKIIMDLKTQIIPDETRPLKNKGRLAFRKNLLSLIESQLVDVKRQPLLEAYIHDKDFKTSPFQQ